MHLGALLMAAVIALPQSVLAADILAVSLDGGGAVTLPANTRIELTSPLALQPNVWLRGSGPTTVIAAALGFSHAALIDTGGNPAGVIGVSDLTIDGSGITDPQAGIGLHLQRVDPGSFVERVIVRRAMRSGICIGSVQGASVGVTVRHCSLIQCGRLFAELHLTDPDFMGVSVVNAIDVTVESNLFQDCPIAINAEQHPGVDDRLWNLQIRGNRIRTSIGYPTCWGISVQGQPERPAKVVLIDGNTLFGVPSFVRERAIVWQYADVTLGVNAIGW